MPTASRLPQAAAPGQAHRLRDYFSQIAYTPAGVVQRLKTTDLPGRTTDNLPLLLYRTAEAEPLNLLIRLFLLGEPFEAAQAARILPPPVHRLFQECELAEEQAGQLRATVRVSPFEQHWITSDTYARLLDATHDDDVLTINNTTRFLLNVAAHTPCRTLFELGTGSGVVALEASRFAAQVTASDLTERSAAFARFNAWLNGIDNIEVRSGNSFEPVAGQKFERILANPPFYITPGSNRIFAENPMDLDGFCRHVVKGAAAHLEEGGLLQMLCEWAEIEDQPWQERLAEWVDGTGCDAFVFTGGRFEPASYATNRIPVVSPAENRAEACARFDRWMDYYRSRKVAALHSGILAMRRRSGSNWLHFESIPSEPNQPAGDAILQRFAVRDHPLSDQQLLERRPSIAAGIRMHQAAEFQDGSWRPVPGARMVQSTGFGLSHEVTPEVAGFLNMLDGTEPLRDSVAKVASGAPVAAEVVEKECLRMVRLMWERGFVTL